MRPGAAAARKQQPASTISNRRYGTGMILQHLAGFDGATWQERWEAAGLDDPDRPVAGLSGHRRRTRQLLLCGMRMLFQWRVVRPCLGAVHANRLAGYAEPFRQMQDDPLLDAFFDLVDASEEGHIAKLEAKFDITAAMTASGIRLAGMTPEGMLYYGIQSRPFLSASENRLPGRQAWHFLRLTGRFPASAPATMRGSAYRGPRSVTEMIDRYQVSDAEVRDLLIDYITRRAAGIDYTTTEALAQGLAGLFWSAIERINPAQRDLRLSQATYEQWKAETAVLPDGRPRKNFDALQLAVRPSTLTCKAGRSPSQNGGRAGPCPARSVTANSAAATAAVAVSWSAWPTGPVSASRSCRCSPSTSTSTTVILKAFSPRRGRPLRARSSLTTAAATGAPAAGTTRTGRKPRGQCRRGSSTRPTDARSTSPPRRTGRSGNGRSWKPSGTPAAASRNCRSWLISASGSTGARTAKSPPCW